MNFYDRDTLVDLAEKHGFYWCAEFEGTVRLKKQKGASTRYVEIEIDSETGAGMVNGMTGKGAVKEIRSL